MPDANQPAPDKDLYVGDDKNLLDKWSGWPAIIENMTNNKFDATFVERLSNCDLDSYGKEFYKKALW